MGNSEYKEVKVICAEDCGNAPKKIVVKDFITAMARNDTSHVTDMIIDQVEWNIVGTKIIRGQDEFLRHWQSQTGLSEVHIENLISHGNTVAANGTEKHDQGKISFCHVYQFSSGKHAKIKNINSYIIP